MLEMRPKRFLNVRDLCNYLEIEINTVYSWVYQKKIPYLKIGRLVKFDKQEIDRWIDSKRVPVSDIYS